ncbi:hypothetical protein GCM10011375_34500 [Hymenobacter qilianensis]|uniref:Uncharacterized protein n=2 Tax=Hymenobacter qilianensis TaxID=1385715 RepID=A0ACB5PVV4_9BACT|nr:hypothetical protein [Hymenobacter qilianensis]QNP51305.1 hypothetical protein H9L05_14690 [Hymenobacter qilianensis]GGF76588.1 hypothetical protein GCM10011375_34500 [Hymenobacter qilianensis]
MKFAPHSLVRHVLPLLVILLTALPACETSKRGIPEVNAADGTDLERRQLEVSSKLVGRVIEGQVEYVVPRAQLATAFIRQFNDGTVVDKTSIRKVQGSPKDKAIYYLVGMGLRNGMYRAMAIPLETSTDNSLYLRSNAERYIVTSVGCTFCYFSFDKNRITGTECEENTGGSRCDLEVESNNNFFPR